MLPLAKRGFTCCHKIELITHCLKTYVCCLMAFLCYLTEVDGNASESVLGMSLVPQRIQQDQEFRSWGNPESLNAVLAVACG